MSNADEFLDYYIKIDLFLKQSGRFNSSDSFSHKVKNSKNRAVQRFKDELISLGELRNAIVHNPKIGNEPIAEPHVSTLLTIRDIHSKITSPQKVISVFHFEVIGAKESDYINEILGKMIEKSFSQFPVFDDTGKVIELINTNTISRWLSTNLDQESTILNEKVTIKNLIPSIEFSTNYKFISKNTSVYEAYDLFIEYINRHSRNLDVLFITNSGKYNEKLLGLITIEDIAPFGRK